MNGKRLANRIVNECEKMGVEAVRLIDVRKRTPFFDFLVIATVDNTVLADALLRKMTKTVELDAGVATFTESSPASDWVVCDYGDTVFMCSLAPTSGSAMTSRVSGRSRSGREEGLFLLRREIVWIRSSHCRL